MKILSGISEGQVLQRLGAKGATVRLSASCAETGPVTVTISDRTGALKGWKNRVVARSRGGAFEAGLAGIPEGGPYRLELICGKAAAQVRAFFVGDVWILSGQSNMQGCADMTSVARPDPRIRAFSMRREWRLATDPLHLLEESPDACHTVSQCSPEKGEELRRKATKGVGAGIFFAREMLKKSNVPQGLLCVAHGGTCMRQWDPALKSKGGDSLYGSMMLSVQATGQPVAGLLWYQGESDANETDVPLYTQRMVRLVAATRHDLRQPDLPWIIVQIARVFGRNNPPASWNNIQEQQRLLPAKIKNLETVAAIDLPVDDFVHIGAGGFPRLGVRLARTADRLVYGNRKEKRPPQLLKVLTPEHPKKSGSPFDAVVEVSFDQVEGGLKSSGEPHGFTILDDDGVPVPMIYKTTFQGGKVQLHVGNQLLPRMPKATLSYGHGGAPVCNLTDGRDFSLPVFGPIPLFPPGAFLPFVVAWKTTGVIPATRPLDKIAWPDVETLGGEVWVHGSDGFINERPRWEKVKTGQAYFAARIELREAMKIEFLMGYDGPFRLWLDRKPFFCNPKGTNPCLPDESKKIVTLKAGIHRITVGMDLNNGGSWGFFLRFRRVDVTPREIESGNYSKPAYSA